MKKQRIKKALVSSALALLLCVSMFIGNTFAWFTDTASTSVNTIKAGNLKVDIIGATEDNSLTGTGLSFVNQNGSKDILWEPGATFRTEGFRIANKGNLALKYQLVLTGITGDADLLNAIEFSVVKADGTAVTLSEFEGKLTAYTTGTDVLYIQGHMKETAGNEYQGKSLTGLGITVYATQDTVEYDSNNNQYDAGATIATVADETTLKAAIANGAAAIILTDDIALSENLTISNDTIIYGNGNTISGYPVWVQTESVKIYDVVFDAPVNSSNNASNLYANGTNKNLVLDGCTFKNTQWDCVQITPENNSDGNIVINNCSFYADTPAPDANQNGVQRFIHIEVSNGSACTTPVNVTLTNNFFGSTANFGYQNTTTKTYNDIIGIYGVDESYINYGGNNLFTDNDKPIWIGWSTNAYANNQDEVYAKLGTLATRLETDTDTTVTLNSSSNPVLDGNNKTISVNKKYGVNVKEGTYTIKNLTVEGASRGLYIDGYGNGGAVTVDNVHVYNCGYALNINSTSPWNLTVTNSTLDGWTSYGDTTTATFTNCSFGTSNYYADQNIDQYLHCLKPYTSTTLTNCEFENGYYIDLSQISNDESITLINCTVDGTVLTADNIGQYIKFEYADTVNSWNGLIKFN